jgi:DNA-binding transcriptional ArsR family regulator
MDALELLAQPVRLRIVHAMRGGQVMTTGQLCERIADVSKATLYRHIEALAAGGVLEVVEERRVRGAVERGFRLRTERASLDPKLAASMSIEDHRSAFAVAMAALIAEFGAYLDRESSDPAHDAVGYRQHAVWLNADELDELNGQLRQALLKTLDNEPAPGRTQYLVSPILFPISDRP